MFDLLNSGWGGPGQYQQSKIIQKNWDILLRSQFTVWVAIGSIRYYWHNNFNYLQPVAEYAMSY